MWNIILDTILTGAAASLALVLPVVVPSIRRYLLNKAKLDRIVGEGVLARHLDEGVENLILTTIQDLQKRSGHKEIQPDAIVAHVEPKMERNFKETVDELGLNHAARQDYIKARIERANSHRKADHK